MRARRLAWRLWVASTLTLLAADAGSAQQPVGEGVDPARLAGRPVAGVIVERAGRPLTDPNWLSLVETHPGRPLSLREVRASLLHFFNTGLFEDVEVAASTGDEVTLTYRLKPLRTITGYVFSGDLGLDEATLRGGLHDRFGDRLPLARAQGATEALEGLLAEYGFYEARVTAGVDSGPTPETATLRFAIAAGRRARIGALEVTGRPLAPAPEVLRELNLASGGHLDGPELDRRLERLRNRARSQGYYEATAVIRRTRRPEAGLVDLTIDIEPGPLVSLRFEGDPIPVARRAELVPIQREASVDEDLLEDSKRRIEQFLHAQGHWRAVAEYRPIASDGRLDIVFRITAGEVFRVGGVTVSGDSTLSEGEVGALLGLRQGDLFVASALGARTAAIEQRYRRNGYTRATVSPEVVERERPPGRSERGAWVDVRLAVAEGPRTLVGAVDVSGSKAVLEALVRGRLQVQTGTPFYEPALAADGEAIASLYLDRGYARVRVEPRVTIDATGGRANIVFAIDEGEQVLVDRVLVVGNRRTSTETIERALTIATGRPLGLADLAESQRRLRALGLFSRVTLADVGEPGASRRDLLVTVEEAPPTTIGYGGGVEAGRFLRQEVVGGPATEQIEFAGRGFLEVSRRNLWGSNRSISVFGRVSVRPSAAPEEIADSAFGFNEYRGQATFREPSVFGTTAEGRITGYFEQAVRSSFNFVRRGIQLEVAKRLRQGVGVVGGYSLSEVRLFDERIAPEDRPDIDRLFPQVRLSKFSVASRRDSRDDVLDPVRGMVIGLDGDLAARAIGSEVGFIKGFGEVFAYRQLPTLRRSVIAGGARLGLARGLTRTAVRLNEDGEPVIGPDGQPIVDEVSDLPASERFFAGGDTTVRGFARDALGDVGTLDPNGFPTGGNAVAIFNIELRTPIWRDVGSAVFVDTGNVFRRVSDLDLGALRASMGFGVRYRSPIGPLRADIGFKLNRRELVEGRLEARYVVHFSIGQAF